MAVPFEDLQRVLAVMAHPDDVDFGCAGTIATLTARGVEVAYVLVTDGDAGGFDPDVPRSLIPGIRQGEQTAAAKEVGVTDLTFLGYPDGALELSHPLRRDISRQIRRFRPQVVITQFPQRNWVSVFASHPDHMLAGEATLRAVYPDARNPFAHPELLAEEGLADWTVDEVWMLAGDKPDYFVDITDVFDKKIAALRRHESQVGMRDPAEFETFLRGWVAANAKTGGLPEGRLAEAFTKLDTNPQRS